MKQWFSASELAGLPSIPGTGRRVRSTANRDAWKSRPRTGRGGGCEYHLTSLPPETQATLIALHQEALPPKSNDGYDREGLWANYERKNEKQKQLAQARLVAINTALGLIDNGTGATAAWKLSAQQSGLNKATLYRWYNKLIGYERTDWLPALVSGYVGRTQQADCDDRAWEFFKADYLRLEAPAAAACYRRLQRAAQEQGWAIPAVRTLERRIEKEIPRTVRVLLRQGEAALVQLYPAQKRSVFNLHALQWINGDGYQHNVFVKWPDGTIARPKTWFWQDIYSRKILSMRTDETENTDMLRLAFGDLVERYGIPDHATIDNTRAAANKWMTGGVPNRYRFKVKDDDPLGVMPILGIKVHWTSVIAGKGHGQAKPVERAFGVGGLGEVVDKHPAFTGAYTGENPLAKPENYGKTAVPLDKFLDILQQEIAAWNAQPSRRTDVCAGQYSFDDAFARSYEQSTIRKATAEQRRLWLLTAEAITVGADGSINLGAGRMGSNKNRYHSHDLYEFTSKKVVVRFDPDALHDAVYVYTLDGRYITQASCITATGFGDTQAARAHNRARRDMVKASKQAAKAEQKMDALEIAAQLPTVTDAETPTAQVVRTFQPTPHHRTAPQRRALTAQEQAALADMHNTDKKVTEIPQSPQQRDRLWVQLDARHKRGESLTEGEDRFYVAYAKTPQWSAFREMEADLLVKQV